MARRETLLRGVLTALVGFALAATTVAAAGGTDTLSRTSMLFAHTSQPSAAALDPPRPPAESDATGTANTTVASGERQAALVTAEDDRLSRVTSGHLSTRKPYLLPAGPGSPATQVLTARAAPYTLASLERLGAAEQAPDGSWLLTHSVVVTRGAELRIQAPGDTLHLSSGPAGFTSVIAFKGTIALGGEAGAPLTVTSWDPTTQAADTDLSDGRAYIRALGSRMDLNRTAVSDLGFWSGRTGGLAWTGNSSMPSTGSLAESVVRGGHYGVFTSRASALALTDSTLQDNELDGLLVHHDSDGLTVRNVTSTANGRDGFALVSGAQRITLTASTASRNAGDGFRIDGSPRVAASTPGGPDAPPTAAPARAAEAPPSLTYTVQRCSATANADAGIVVSRADNVLITGNTVSGSGDGIVVRGPADAPQITGNTVDAGGFAIAVRNGVTTAQLHNNNVRSSAVGLHVLDSVADLGTNSVTASRYGVSLVGNVTGSSVIANRVSGRGLAAVDTVRLAPAATADVAGNDEDTWVTDRDNVAYWTGYAADHPLLLLWLLILLIPLAARIWARRRRTRSTAPDSVQDDPVDEGEPAAPPAEEPATEPAPVVELDVLHDVEVRVEATAELPEDMGATMLLPVTRVTVVSGLGAAP